MTVNSTLNTYAEQQKPSEYQVKTVFLYNLMKFVEWPISFIDTNPNINLCILGDDPFGSALNSIRGETIGGKKLAIRHFKSLKNKNLEGCQVLFICASEKERLKQIVKSLKGSNVLTVSDTEGFAQQGVIINFYMEQNKVRFEINVSAARQAGLKISSKLLKLAKIIED